MTMTEPMRNEAEWQGGEEDVRTTEFHAWAAALRASVEAMERLLEDAHAKERAVARLLRHGDADPVSVRRLRQEIGRLRLEAERRMDTLPTLA
jgi:hypothetical protein